MADDFKLDRKIYERCVRLFDRARHLLGVRIHMHQDTQQLHDGDVFLFNHFARAESFIPQYCIYVETGALCRSIAAGELFRGNERISQLLSDLGAVPNDHPELLPLLAADILRGRKIIVFPEGGMVKDRQVLDDQGEFNVYSRSAGSRRKHHSGAARLAIGLQVFKQAVLQKVMRSRVQELARWTETLGLPSVEVLIERARKPVVVVPANITFYPLRVQDNFLRRGADLLFGKLSPRATEELIVEGNLFFKATDMDIRCGTPIRPHEHWEWWERMVVDYMARGMPNLDAIFAHEYLQETLVRKIAARGLHASVESLRDRSMREIYRRVTVNMSHLAAQAILSSVERGIQEFSLTEIARVLYLAVKRLQPLQAIHLHRGLLNPDEYRRLLDGGSPELQEFLAAAVSARLLAIDGDRVRCLEKLTQEHAFDQVRLENPLEVYANEIAPLEEVRTAVDAALEAGPRLTMRESAAYAFTDELRALDWDRQAFNEDKHRALNAQETATVDPAPFLCLPDVPNPLGVLLVHGFLATPGETRPVGEALLARGYPVLGVRLKGHGTSPWDLRERTWTDWLQSVQRGFDILSAHCERVCVVGFSTGGALTLLHAATLPRALAGIVAIAPLIGFRNRNMRFVPLVHGANQIVEWVSRLDGILPFRPTDTEHPHINYRHMPIRGLYELTRMVSAVKKILPAIRCPALIIQGRDDPVVDPTGAQFVVDRLGSTDKQLAWIDSRRHGILYEDIGETHNLVRGFLARLKADVPLAVTGVDAEL